MCDLCLTEKIDKLKEFIQSLHQKKIEVDVILEE